MSAPCTTQFLVLLSFNRQVDARNQKITENVLNSGSINDCFELTLDINIHENTMGMCFFMISVAVRAGSNQIFNKRPVLNRSRRGARRTRSDTNTLAPAE